ncbi:double-strand break repair helicase AddA [Sphingomonas sp. MAH-20]|uniref:DNA 3'-5' helicase n=1 Tax=Sphingomonas horti TaxID=2682842 RepID=A0A6I4J208_9SPHN|nr:MULTISPECIES: double-strand break repair helicase AddA [Sphingomonas]MBA2919585.1 double-strand break repair helicase AddA [Sphingomonas sp. CGMCC 1.13658]MVO78465.1 double-strand break repair helicase AddA [Sphingomonas horti]
MRPLPPLQPEQREASDPRAQVWLSASAGTGKTQVLVARVLRLLLRSGTDPSSILCLTFTKAGAAEMANRLSERLAHWVRLPGAELATELKALGEDFGPAAQAQARGLFARVLDARGGGLRIQTIHSFAQALLASFPLEAGLAPGMRPLEGREETALARRVLADLVLQAEREGRRGLIADLQALSRRLGEEGAETFLRDCARAPDAMAQLPPGIAPFVRRALDIPVDDIEAHIAEQCGDALFDLASLEQVAFDNRDWGTAKGLDRAEVIGRWRGLSPGDRALALEELHSVWATTKGDPRSFGKGQAPQTSGYAELASRLHGRCKELIEIRVRARLADLFAAALDAGRAYAHAYAEAKRAAGVVDFDDLIRATVRLLGEPGMGEWIRYKLDQATDHILVDEAQDTNANQWAIVGKLAEEFYAGTGRKGLKLRTIFSVGDFKQAIFGFQGTDPNLFNGAREWFRARIDGVEGWRLKDLSLDRSFRSTPPVLEAVDATLAGLVDGALGDGVRLEPHRSAVGGPGLVTLWKPVSAEQADDEEGEEGWVDDAQRQFATGLARQIKGWLSAPMMLGKGPLRPQDIMVLVRKRGDLASLIVARLYAEGVPVAGLDRLRLNAPLGVRDLLAAARFALQPDDDLTLASLLVSPLIGWSQEQLLANAVPRQGSLWRHLRQGRQSPLVRSEVEGRNPDSVPAPLDYARDERVLVPAVESLTAILNAADFTTPYRFFENILSGPLDGRRRLLARLGEEARDPVEELLSAALAFERQATPSLQRFLDWFDRGDVDIVRDPSQPLDAVRVMTAHGAKGLQAPLVILADATTDPGANRRNRLDWKVEGLAEPLPLFRPRKDELAGSLADDLAEAERKDREEHWRLLYVAMTRAEERLYVGGALGPRAKGVPPEDSWYAAVERGLKALGAEPLEDGRLEWAGRVRQPAGKARTDQATRDRTPESVPEWARRPAPQEARPPRPLAPSSIGLDEAADPPPSPQMRAAAERGRLLHALFERLPTVRTETRAEAGERWLTGAGGVADPELRAELIATSCAIIADPRFADVFAADALAEVPLAAVVEGRVVAGKVDRLHVSDDRVRVVDFKTNRRAPSVLAEAPGSHLKQMAAYAAALARVFPGRSIEAALLYTAGPVLLPLDAETLERFKPGLADA